MLSLFCEMVKMLERAQTEKSALPVLRYFQSSLGTSSSARAGSSTIPRWRLGDVDKHPKASNFCLFSIRLLELKCTQRLCALVVDTMVKN